MQFTELSELDYLIRQSRATPSVLPFPRAGPFHISSKSLDNILECSPNHGICYLISSSTQEAI